MKKIWLFILFSFLSALLLGGCGGLTYEMKARVTAQTYIKDKYGFDADVTNVLLSENSWLEFSFEPPLFAHVRMEHGGTEFDVLVPIRDNENPMLCDNYERGRICAEIESYVRTKLRCDDMAVRADYGSNYGNHLLPMDIRSAEELKKSAEPKTVSVFAYGLDADSVDDIDTAVYGENTNFSVVEWDSEELPEVPYGLIREIPSQCGWNVSSLHCTDNRGNWEHKRFSRVSMGNVCLVMPEECNITMSLSDGPGEPDDIPVTEWYTIKGSGEGYGALYASAGAAPDEEYCVEYAHKGKAYYERMPHTDGDSPEYELYSHRYCSPENYEFTFRVVKRDFYGGMKDE